MTEKKSLKFLNRKKSGRKTGKKKKKKKNKFVQKMKVRDKERKKNELEYCLEREKKSLTKK